MRAGQPCAVASDGMTIQSSTSTPSAPTDARRRRGPSAAAGCGIGTTAVHERADDEPERLADRRDEEQEAAPRPTTRFVGAACRRTR